MNAHEKVNLLIKYENKNKLKNKHFKKLVKLSKDKDTLVRSLSADLLINFENRKSKKTLLKLASDKKWLVRASAYDSLKVFEFEDVEKFLKKAIKTEKKEIAWAYAIESWAKIVIVLDDRIPSKRKFVHKLQKLPDIQKSERCTMHCYYALYILGEKKNLKKISGFLQSKDYLIRCSTVNTFRDILEGDNKKSVRKFIRKSLEDLIKKEDTVAVRSRATALIKFIDDGAMHSQ